MGQDILVSERMGDGQRLIDELVGRGFEALLAFWAKPTEDGMWLLFMASPFWDEKGTQANRFLIDLLREKPDFWIDSMEIRLLGMNDSRTKAALAARKPRPYPRMTSFGGSNLGGMEVDGALIYPEPVPTGAV